MIITNGVGEVKKKMCIRDRLRSPSGEILRRSQVPPIPAPNDLYPKVMEIPLWTRGIDLAGCSVELDPENRMKEITKTNNRIVFQGGAL